MPAVPGFPLLPLPTPDVMNNATRAFGEIGTALGQAVHENLPVSAAVAGLVAGNLVTTATNLQQNVVVEMGRGRSAIAGALAWIGATVGHLKGPSQIVRDVQQEQKVEQQLKDQRKEQDRPKDTGSPPE